MARLLQHVVSTAVTTQSAHFLMIPNILTTKYMNLLGIKSPGLRVGSNSTVSWRNKKQVAVPEHKTQNTNICPG